MEWHCKKQAIKQFYRKNIIGVFFKQSQINKPSRLRLCYSEFKSTLFLNQSVNISQYSKFMAFLKRQSVVYWVKNFKTFLREEIIKFLIQAHYNTFLLIIKSEY